ncbi:MAG: hypothetical protein ACREJB_04135 [Planctomycetaceae bacterium]
MLSLGAFLFGCAAEEGEIGTGDEGETLETDLDPGAGEDIGDDEPGEDTDDPGTDTLDTDPGAGEDALDTEPGEDTE